MGNVGRYVPVPAVMGRMAKKREGVFELRRCHGERKNPSRMQWCFGDQAKPKKLPLKKYSDA